MAEPRHPREVFDLVGHEASEQAFEATRQRGRLHHAWLLTGPEGVGKATFAYRAARRLLGAPANEDFGVLGSDPEHPVCRQMMARVAQGQGGLEGWGQAWETLQRLSRDVEALNLDRTDALFTALGELRHAARAA